MMEEMNIRHQADNKLSEDDSLSYTISAKVKMNVLNHSAHYVFI